MFEKWQQKKKLVKSVVGCVDVDSGGSGGIGGSGGNLFIFYDASEARE